ncbi:peroxisomal leader peptide-processing protease [Dromaius novaehollandiae]|uniref:peroxisomal leader peptide-processing protease n=1 Tax=Dromaius novaehollandiae TaxID=8790 RepID=UPI00311FFE98
MPARGSRCHAAERSGCAVSVRGPAEAAGPWSCSGVVLSWDPAVVLCHGAVFAALLRDGPAAWARREALPPGALRPGLRVRVLRPAGPGGRPRRHEARLLALVPCAAFAEALAGAAAGAEPWRFGGEPAAEPRALGWFGLLRAPGLDGGGGGGWTARGAAAALRKGQALVACGSPFGALCPDLFLNTLSAGVLSNAAGPRNALLLTDARCLPGTEGGGVFAAAEARLVGVVAAPLCWKGRECLGLALVCSLDAILSSAAAILEQAGAVPPPLPPPDEDEDEEEAAGLMPALLRHAALVQCGSAWGSGALLGPRLLLTCRHVLQPGARVTVRAAAAGGAALAGRVVFASAEESPFDVAVVELERSLPGLAPPRLAARFRPGEAVSVLSFGGLGGACGPSVTAGVLSAVVAVAGRPVMLQTTCAVQAGASGAPLFATRTGHLLGIVASNAKDTSVGATYPHLNFSVPITLLRPALARYRRTGDPAAFAALHGAAAEGARAVWRLQRAPPGVPFSKL